MLKEQNIYISKSGCDVPSSSKFKVEQQTPKSGLVKSIGTFLVELAGKYKMGASDLDIYINATYLLRGVWIGWLVDFR